MTALAFAGACGGSTEENGPPDERGGVTGTAGSAISGASGPGAVAGRPSSGGSGATPTAGAGATSGTVGTAGQAAGGSSPSGGTSALGGGDGDGDAGEAGGGGSPGSGGSEGYLPRTGPFNLLVYSLNRTGGYQHPSIPAGQEMLTAIGQKQGFNVTIATDESEITPIGLAKYEIVFFLNSSGDIFKGEGQRKAYEDWITKDGAYAGVHAAAETASNWAFYKELTGQTAGPHDACCANADIQWTVEGGSHITAKGLPSPWTRAEEWLTFDQYSVWSTKAGFKILSMVTTMASGTRPVSYLREWGNFRSFYTSLGHESKTYQDPEFIRHITAGIMWAVRREALIKD